MTIAFRLSFRVWALSVVTLSCGGSRSATVSPAVDSHANVVEVACGDFHTCARMRDGTVRCWGRNEDGELGFRGKDDAERPVPVPGLMGVEQLALGSTFSCARLSDRTVRCWGTGSILGDDRYVTAMAPTPLPSLRDVVELKAGGYVACARTSKGDETCWGLPAVRTPVPVPSVVEMTAAAAHACARLSDGKVKCWGEGAWSETSDPSFGRAPVTDAVRVSTGDSFACALLKRGTVSCWGRNDQGELGSGEDDGSHTAPIRVIGLDDASGIASGEAHTCARRGDTSVWCWGSNGAGQLGRGTSTLSGKAAVIFGLDHVVALSAGGDHTCALVDNGSVECWGDNRSGQLGDGTNVGRPAPVAVAF